MKQKLGREPTEASEWIPRRSRGTLRHVIRTLAVLAPLVTGGCLWDEIAAPKPPTPAGTVTIQLNGGTPKSPAALAHLKDSPMVLDGASPDVTVSITIVDDAGGADPKATLGQAGGAIALQLTATSRNRLEVHSGGGGCV